MQTGMSKETGKCKHHTNMTSGARSAVSPGAIRDFKIRDATAVRRGRKKIFTEVTYCACSSRHPDGMPSRRERGFANFDVLYKT